MGQRQQRLRIRLLDDGYPGWIEPNDLLGQAEASPQPRPRPWNRHTIEQRLDAVLDFGHQAMKQPNRYLWGGSLGPNFDCSGLVQTAYASQEIWLPRDAYLQERFCQPVAVHSGITHLLEPGDRIFFGSPQRCTHVGLHLSNGNYLHSSGATNGHNGLAIDNLSPANGSSVASHYRQNLRGAGRVMHGHDGSPLPA
jgi:cell wall-associated NlpC family hydrolase